MNAPTGKIEAAPDRITDAFYREHARCQLLHRKLMDCLIILGMEADRREREGRDELHLREFVARTKRELRA